MTGSCKGIHKLEKISMKCFSYSYLPISLNWHCVCNMIWISGFDWEFESKLIALYIVSAVFCESIKYICFCKKLHFTLILH